MLPMKTLRVLILLILAPLAGAQTLTILVTGDEHGWLQPVSAGGRTVGGAAEMLAQWKRVEGLDPSRFLVLSGGDVATGPAVSTVYQGLPAVEVMNAMGYDAAALGNHEFDFGLEQLHALVAASQHPVLSGNVYGTDGKPLVQPFAIIEKAGIKVGVIGLTTDTLKQSAGFTESISVTAYADALRKWAPIARKKGAQLLVVVSHVELEALLQLAPDLKDLGIPLMMGAHSHALAQVRDPESGTWVVNSGQWWTSYSRIDLDFDPKTKQTVVLSSKQAWLSQKDPEADPAVKAVVAKWQSRLDADPAYASVLGHLSSPLPRFYPVYNFVCDAWLEADRQSDVALNNEGALRQDLPPGPITLATLTGLMPFSNSLLRLKLKGKVLQAYLDLGRVGMAGIKGALKPEATYKVLVNNYMYDKSPLFQEADPKPVLAFEDWRQPVIQFLKRHPSSAQKPLEKILDFKPRP
jgi:2',3'-cyclic-nucleotide 2'-phosphodiesterase (5'-nucleotidase family)